MPPETDNLQLADLFDEDQKDRERALATPEEIERLKARDASRRKRVRAMMEFGEVRTKDDLYRASLVLYHGSDPEDFLSAHRLAAVSAMMGHKSARWLTAASLDRCLMSVGLGQVYGTQFEYVADMQRYQLRLPMQEQALLSFEKEFLGVPSIADRLAELNKRVS